MYFTSECTVSCFDCDRSHKMRISAALRRMQQTSSEHLAYLDMPYEKLFRENMVFLLTKMCVKVTSLPVAAQNIVVGTAAVSVRGPRFIREFIIEDKAGNRLLSALSLWVLVNPVTRKILRPSQFPYPLPLQDTLLHGIIGDVQIPRLPLPAAGAGFSVPIRYSHIDTNNHVNNSVYADFVCDALPYERVCGPGLDTLVISYQNEAVWGDTVDISSGRISDKEYYVNGKKDGGSCFESYAVLK